MIDRQKPIYYSAEEVNSLLSAYPSFQKYLYSRGFLLTTQRRTCITEYPFYGNWTEYSFNVGNTAYYIYAHNEIKVFSYEGASRVLFLIGHAYDPYEMITAEEELLRRLDVALDEDEQTYWKLTNNMTGVFCTGILTGEKVIFANDCCGMQIVYHGVISGELYAVSHSKLVADILGLEQSQYIRRLIKNRFWPLWGMWLPGDCSPFSELRRLVPNHYVEFHAGSKEERIRRFYPTEKICETVTEEEFEKTIDVICDAFFGTMTCISQKWCDKCIGLSLTGGRDSTASLSCVGENKDNFSYFSYYSNDDEYMDVCAAGKILNHIGLTHHVHIIPLDKSAYREDELELFRILLSVNSGCIGFSSRNEIKKRLFFKDNTPCDVEIKSWVGEIGRAWEYNKYKKHRFPAKPYPAYWRAMHKIYLSPRLIHDTDHIFKDYLEQYYSDDVFERIPWTELYFWEFASSAVEGIELNGEHRISYEITVPYNNRRLAETMLTVPLEKRINDEIPKAIILKSNPKIAETGIVIKDISHTDLRAIILRCYLAIMSKIHF